MSSSFLEKFTCQEDGWRKGSLLGRITQGGTAELSTRQGNTWTGLAVAAAYVCVGPLAPPPAVRWQRVVALTDALLHTRTTRHAARSPFEPVRKPTMHCKGRDDARFAVCC